MTLAQAIEILTFWQNGDDITSFDDVNTAAKLGIKALNHTLFLRKYPKASTRILLPGETKE